MQIKNAPWIFLVVLIEEIFCDVKLLAKFHQKDYKIRNVRVEVIEYNKNLINFLQVKTFKYNRTTTAFNGTINTKRDMSTELEGVIQVYKLLSNEYRYFPIRVRLNACESLAADVLGSFTKLTHCGNVTACFIAKETTYHICNYTPDFEHLPPNIPTGEFMLENQVYYLNISLGRARAYGEVYRPIYPKDKKGSSGIFGPLTIYSYVFIP